MTPSHPLRRTLPILALLLALAGCAGPTYVGPRDLAGTAWRVVAIDGVEPAGAELDVDFGVDGRINGFGGVNRYFGAVVVEGNRLNVGPIGSTLMAGDPALLDQEHRLHAALESVARAELDGTTLRLLREDGSCAVRLAPAE